MSEKLENLRKARPERSFRLIVEVSTWTIDGQAKSETVEKIEIEMTCGKCGVNGWSRNSTHIYAGGHWWCPACEEKRIAALVADQEAFQGESSTWEAWGDLERQEERDA